MKKHFYPLEILFLFMFSMECILILEDEHKQYFWVTVGLVGMVSYIYEGARPYTPVFMGIAVADCFDWDILQKILLFLSILLVHFIRFYHIPIVGKGPYNAGYRYYCSAEAGEQMELAVFYPSMSDGHHPKWIPSERYDMVLYDIAHVDPREVRLPYRFFRFIMSYLVKMKMPVLGDASLCVDDCNKEEKWKVVVFSHGLGSNLNNYSALCGWWATHGYIVVSIQHHHDRVRLDYGKELLGHHDILEKMYYDSRNGDLRVRTAETQAVLLQLTAGNLLSRVFKEVKSLAVEEVYLAGHSFGGTTVLETLANLRRTGGRPAAVKGVIGLDAWFFPLSESTYEQLRGERMLLLNSETFFTVTPYFYYMEEKMERIRQNNPAAQILMVRSTDHLSISDFAFAMGTLLQLLKAVRLQQLSEPILELHEVVISLFMEGRSKQEVLSVSHKYAHDRGLIAKGVEVVKEWRFVRAKQN